MFKVISLAMHFSPYNHGPIDPTVAELLNNELKPKPQPTDNVIDLQHPKQETETRKAA
jgi:hypothetical protein